MIPLRVRTRRGRPFPVRVGGWPDAVANLVGTGRARTGKSCGHHRNAGEAPAAAFDSNLPSGRVRHRLAGIRRTYAEMDKTCRSRPDRPRDRTLTRVT